MNERINRTEILDIDTTVIWFVLLFLRVHNRATIIRRFFYIEKLFTYKRFPSAQF